MIRASRHPLATCSPPTAEAYFDRPAAPRKGVDVCEQSAHSPVFEQPQQAHAIGRDDVLTLGTLRDDGT